MPELGVAPSRHPSNPNDRDEISLTPLVDAAWLYRRVIGLGIIVTAVVLGTIGLGLFLRAPVERVSSIGFRVEMEGASEGTYPNGMRFSPNDLIATPVLTEVYNANQLNQYVSYHDFASSIFIQYQPLEYRLTLRRHERLGSIPPVVLAKALTDTLAVWARHAERKGALRYQLPMLGPNILNWEVIERQDHLVAIDMLRSTISRILDNIERLQTFPGANTIRSGPKKMSLAEIAVALQDLQRFDIEALIAFTSDNVVAKDPRWMSTYVENQLFQLQVKGDEAALRVTAREEALQQYTMRSGTNRLDVQLPGSRSPGGNEAPVQIQLSDSFLEKLMTMAAKSDDVGYRQKLTDSVVQERLALAKTRSEISYYESLAKSFSRRNANVRADTSAVERRIRDAFDRISQSIEQVSALFADLSSYNLNPSSRLYTVTTPYAQTEMRGISMSRFAASGLVALMMTLMVLVIGSLAHYHFRRDFTATSPERLGRE